LKRGWRKKRSNSRKQLKNNLPEARPENCFCGAPDRPKPHPTSTTGFDLPAYSRPGHWKIWFPIRRSEAHPSAPELAGGPQVQDYQASLEKLRSDAAEAALIRDLATDMAKRKMFDRLAKHLDQLADDVERAMNPPKVSQE
jgi:hypothetical protein